jgi:hypothetical protein
MKLLVESLIDWLDQNRSDVHAHRILRALAEETRKRADSPEKSSGNLMPFRLRMRPVKTSPGTMTLRSGGLPRLTSQRTLRSGKSACKTSFGGRATVRHLK